MASPAWVWHGDEGNRGFVERAGWLVVEEMGFGHHGNRGDVPGKVVFSHPGDLFDSMATFTLGMFAGPLCGPRCSL